MLLSHGVERTAKGEEMASEGIRVPAGQAEHTETVMTTQGQCNMLVTWDPGGEWVEYCGRRAKWRGLCSHHEWFWFDQEPDR